MTANPPAQRGVRTPAPDPRADVQPARRQVSPTPARRPDSAEPPGPLLRRLIGATLRRIRLGQGRTLRDVSRAAGVSLPYLSELERGRKEPSSEVLGAICRALGMRLADLLDEVRDELFRLESPGRGPGMRVVRGRAVPGPDGRALPGRPAWDQVTARPPAGPRADVRERGPVMLGGALRHPPVTLDAGTSQPSAGGHRIGFGVSVASTVGGEGARSTGSRPLSFRLVGFGGSGLDDLVVPWPIELAGPRIPLGGPRPRRAGWRAYQNGRRPHDGRRAAASRLVVFCGREVPARPARAVVRSARGNQPQAVAGRAA